MLSSTVPCPRCGGDSLVTVFGPTGDISRAEITFSCPNGHDVPPAEAFAAWNATRGIPAAS